MRKQCLTAKSVNAKKNKINHNYAPHPSHLKSRISCIVLYIVS